MKDSRTLKLVGIGVCVFVATLIVIVGIDVCKAKPYTELDTRYKGVIEIKEDDFESIPTLNLGE